MVKVQTDKNGSRLLLNGKPYTMLGVGGTTSLQRLASIGGNTIRTWGAEDIGPLLDKADREGIKVVAGIWLEHKRHGFDYNDPELREEELRKVERQVKSYRDHPALLAWGIGNELELGGDFDQAIRQINDAAALVKKLDPNHPRMAVIAEIGDGKAERIARLCPDIDFIGINSYGGLGSLPRRLQEQGYTGPWAVTEYGVVGHWESGTTPWGAPYEQSSSEKADFLRRNYEQSIAPNLKKQCLGSFAFLWGQKQEKTSTWYGLLLEDGSLTQRVDALEELWTGAQPANHSPRVRGVQLLDADSARLELGQRVRVRVDADDPDGDPMVVEWMITKESGAQSIGGDHEQSIEAVDTPIKTIDRSTVLITMPKKDGAYRIFVTVRDGHGRAGTANLPVYVGSAL
ncbi:MAG: glycoside hydrolase family 2 TIM barrel-domain containing protein [Phycisphaerales bacterium]